MSETTESRSKRILRELKKKYPQAQAYDLDGKGTHFVCELEPTKDHPEYDKAIEVIIMSAPHKHLKTTQRYTVLSETLLLTVENQIFTLSTGDKHTITPGQIHSAESDNEVWVEIHSRPGWTEDDHILI